MIPVAMEVEVFSFQDGVLPLLMVQLFSSKLDGFEVPTARLSSQLTRQLQHLTELGIGQFSVLQRNQIINRQTRGNIPMTRTLDKPKDQRLIHRGMSWEKFKLIQAGFADAPGVRLFYFQGEVEILAVSQDHEFFSRTISGLLFVYCLEKRIPFAPTGSFTQEKEGIASVQADESYFIGRSRTSSLPPDLSIEVVFTSGNESKLNRYRAILHRYWRKPSNKQKT